MSPRSASPRNFASIQCLRGIAASLVVLLHAHTNVLVKFPHERSWLNAFYSLREIGAVGVDIFFVVSGFIMFYVYQGDFGRPGAALNFLVRRLIRIVPLYWILTALMIAILLTLPAAFSTLRFDLRHATESMLFLPTRNLIGEFFPVLNVGWTLSYEIYFYALFACFLGTSAPVSLAVIGVLFCVTAVLGHWFAPGSPVGAMLTNDILIEFVLGGVIGYAAASGRVLSERAARAAAVIALAVFAAQIFVGLFPDGRLPGRGVPAFLLVAALVSLEVRRRFTSPGWLRTIGDESYSLYLSHIITLAIFFKLCVAGRVTRWVPVDLLIPAAVVTGIMTARPVYRWLERPMLRGMNKVWERSAHSDAA